MKIKKRWQPKYKSRTEKEKSYRALVMLLLIYTLLCQDINGQYFSAEPRTKYISSEII